MILARWVSFRRGDTPFIKPSDELSPRDLDFRASSSITCLRRQLRSISSSCLKPKSTNETTELENEATFSVLASDIPWEERETWRTLGLYMFCLHIPLSFGGLSIVSHVLHQRLLNPQTEVLSLLALQMLELFGTLFLLKNTARPECGSINFMKGNESREGRNWLLGSALGLGCVVGFIFLTSLVADELFGSQSHVGSLILQAVPKSEVEKIMENGEISRDGCIALYCIVAPILEEIVYRRFLLTSLQSKMEWWKAVVMSSGVFAAAHFSGEEFVQLFMIGCVLGACYSWSGNLASSVIVHSLYNALTLLLL